MSIALIDTSVLCNIVPVPGLDQHRGEILSELEHHIRSRTTLLLPLAAVVETGNHIAHVPDGQKRRSSARSFCEELGKAIDGQSPWTPTPFWDVAGLRSWLPEFPDRAMKRIGMGDLSIIKEWERQCAWHPTRRVFIWALDRKDLSGYDRKP